MFTTRPAVTVVIADDHEIVRDGLRTVVGEIPGFATEIVGEAENGIEAISITKASRPDLLLLDAGMPLSRGMEVFGEVRRWSPETKVAVVTGFTGAGLLGDWISAGVDGLFLKSSTPEEMKRGFAVLLDGGTYVSEDVQQILETESNNSDLTLREKQVLRLMAKLNVHSLAQLLSYALREGLLDPSGQT